MNKQIIPIFTFLICLLSITIASSQSSSQQYDDILKEHAYEGAQTPGLSVIITRKGEEVYENATGLANIELGIPMTPDHVFRIGSITKQFTSSAILRLQEQGKLSVQDELTKYIPDYPTMDNTITVEHLLTHTSGIKSYTGMTSFREKHTRTDMSPEEMVDIFKNEAMDFNSGDDYKYNNSGYFLLGYIIEKVSGMSYGEYIETEFFKPLGMNDSYYGGHRQLVNNRVDGYEKEEGAYINADFLSMTLPYAAGSLLSTTGDLAKWYQAVMNDKVISKESRIAAHTGYTLNGGKQIDYGYGWGVDEFRGSPTIGHGGGIDGFLTASTYYPEEEVFVAVFANCMCTDPQQIAVELGAVAIGKPIVAPDAVAVDEAWAGKYLGDFELRPGLIINVSREGDKFIGKPTGQGKVELIPTGLHEFYIKEIDSKLAFNTDEGGNVPSLVLHQGGAHTAMRVEIEEVSLSAAELQKYVGTFEVSPGQSFVFREAAGKLYGRAGSDESELTPSGQHNFYAKDEGVKVRFNTSDAGEIESVTVYMGGEHLAKKVK